MPQLEGLHSLLQSRANLYTLQASPTRDFTLGSPPTGQLMTSNPFIVSRLDASRFPPFVFQASPQGFPFHSLLMHFRSCSVCDPPCRALASEFMPSAEAILGKSRASWKGQAVCFLISFSYQPYPQRLFSCRRVEGGLGDCQ